MLNVDQIQSRLKTLPQPALFQAGIENQHDAVMFGLINSENDRRQQIKQQAMSMQAGQQPPVNQQDLFKMAPSSAPNMGAGIPLQGPGSAAQMMPPTSTASALPENTGIGALPANNLQRMAGGGITGYDEGGTTYLPAVYKRYAMQQAQKLGLPPTFVDGIFTNESHYNPHAKSKTGPIGIGQLAADTAKGYGLDPSERTDGFKNIDASLAFMKDLQGKYKNDPQKMALAYNQGETFTNKHLKANNGQVVPDNLNKPEAVNYLKKLNDYLPMSSAHAEVVPGREPAQAPAQAGQAPAQTPTQAEIDAASKPGFVTPSSGIGSRRLGTTGAGPLSNALASGQGQIQAVLGAGDLPYNLLGLPMDVSNQLTKMFGFGNKTPDENIFGSSAYLKKKATEMGLRTPTPTDPTLAGFREAGNIGASLVVPGGPSAGGVADLAAARAAQAARAQEAERIANTPRLPVAPSAGAGLPPGSLVGNTKAVVGTPAQMLPRTAEDMALDSARTGEALTNLRKDQEIAEAQRAAAVKLNAQEAPSTMRINPLGAASLAVNSGPAISSMLGGTSGNATPNYDAMTQEADREFGPSLQGTKQTPSTSDTAKTVTDTAGGKGGRDWNDFLLNLGLGMMAGTSPYALQNIGNAGIGALKQEQEAKKAELEERKLAAEEALNKQHGAYFAANAKYMEDQRGPMGAMGLAQKQIAAWDAQNIGAPPEQQAAAHRAIINETFRNTGIINPGMMTPERQAALAQYGTR
jgi:soluble lytic murein transglycosylase-like protein